MRRDSNVAHLASSNTLLEMFVRSILDAGFQTPAADEDGILGHYHQGTVRYAVGALFWCSR